jgi:sulfur relay protein TusB/DsrH
MESILFLLRSAPTHPDAPRALDFARSLKSQGHAVSVLLLQDAVLAGVKVEGPATDSHIAQTLQSGISVYALDEDLALRGLTEAKLWEGLCVANYTELVDLMDRHARVVGAL